MLQLRIAAMYSTSRSLRVAFGPFVLLILSAGACAQSALARPPGVDLDADSRLSARVYSHIAGAPIESALVTLTATVPLRVEASLRDRRVTLYCGSAPLRDIMRA